MQGINQLKQVVHALYIHRQVADSSMINTSTTVVDALLFQLTFVSCSSNASIKASAVRRNVHEIKSSRNFQFPLWKRGLGGFYKSKLPNCVVRVPKTDLVASLYSFKTPANGKIGFTHAR
jgi:hypothetical protein